VLLSDLPPLNGNELAGVVRSVAFSLAQRHAMGRVHGQVDARHVSVDPDGRINLVDPASPVPGTAEDDVRALGQLILDGLAHVDGAAPPSGHPPRPGIGLALARLLHPSGRRRPGLLQPPSPEQALIDIARLAAVEAPTPPPSAASVAALIALRVPGACPPGSRSSPPDPIRSQAAATAPPHALPPAPRRPTGTVVAAVLVGLALLAGVVAMVRAVASRGHRLEQAAPARLPVAATASTTSTVVPGRVWPGVSFHDGVLTTSSGRFSVGRTDDVVLAGDWFCRGQPVPALLRPATGEVFVFDRWPAGDEQVTGTLAGQVAGARSLEAVSVEGQPCPALTAVSPDGTATPVPIDPPEPVR
jgi:hypothetical protein